MIMYAIRHKPTGLFLPRINSRGSTHHEPTAPLEKARLFHRGRDAKGFLSVWLRGKQTQREYQDFNGDYDAELNIEPVPTRKRDEMEIVTLEVREVRAA